MTAEEYFDEGKRLIDNHSFEKAIVSFTEAIQLNPQDAKAYYNRGRAKSKLQRYEQAIQDYDHAIQLNPQDADAYYNRGVAKSNLQRYEQAIQDYDHAIQLNPQDADAYYNRGSAKGELQRYEQAIQDYDQAIQLNPQDAKAYYNRGVAKSKLQRYEQAIQDYDHAIQLNPQDADAYYNRGSAKGELQRYEQAIQDYDQAIQLNPQDANAYNNRGGAKGELQRYEQAIQDYDHAIQLNPQHALPWYGKGVIYFRKNNPDWARSCLIRAIYLGLPHLRNIFIFFGKHPIAPFLTMRLIQEKVAVTAYSKLANLIQSTFQQSSPLYAFLVHESLRRDKKHTTTDWNKWLGIINYYMGDPITSFQLLGAIKEKGPHDLMVRYYYIMSCFDIAEDPGPAISQAIEIAERIRWQKQKKRFFSSVKFTEEQLVEYYYAGHIFLFNDESDNALECFSKIQSYFLPAAYMSLFILHNSKEWIKRDHVKRNIIKRERKQEKTGFAKGLSTHTITFDKDSLQQPFIHYFRYFELSSAIAVLHDIVQNGIAFEVRNPYHQKPFYELFRISSDDIEDSRRRLALRPMLKDWEDRLRTQKETTTHRDTDFQVKGPAMKAAFRELVAAADNGLLETEMGEHIEEFSLKPEQYSELLHYFHLKGDLTEYQKLLLSFHLLDQVYKSQTPSKVQLAGLKDAVKKTISDGLSVMTGIVVGGTLSGLPALSALAIGIGTAFAKGALSELFIAFYQETPEKSRLTYSEFKAKFERYIAEEKERLGSKFEKRYPIDELHRTMTSTNS